MVEHNLPPWEDLAGALPKELESLKDRLPWAKERRFGLAAGEEPRVIFYRDNSSWCPYCERVWLQLEEKRVPHKVEKVNMRCYGPKPEWYTRMVPSGLLPAVKIDGELITESMDIMLRLEQEFPERPLLPTPGSQESKALQGLLHLERQLFGSWLRFITSGWGDAGNGQRFEETMADVDGALRRFGGPYFLGKEFSMIDAVYAPFLERIAASVPYYKGLLVRGNKWSAVSSWYDAMDSRPPYQAMKSDDFTHVHDLPPQIGECYHNDASKDYWALVDGKAGSWDLPLKPETTGWGFDDGTGGKAEAAWNLINNHAAVVKFASRPLRNDAESYAEAVDVVFRYVAKALVEGTEKAGDLPAGLPKQVKRAAEHLRDNVGVPRDMSYPAARQLRAHLNWAIRQL